MTVSVVDTVFSEILLGRKVLTEALYDRCEAEGIVPIAANVATNLAAVHKQAVHQAVAHELVRYQSDVEVLEALHDAGVDVLVIKGTALAYTLYDEPWHRSRNDTDLFIRSEDLEKTRELLLSLGYTAAPAILGPIAVAELAFTRGEGTELAHTIDVHWRLNNSWQLSQLVGFDELWDDRIPVERLGQHAWCCSRRWALLISAIHRAAHQRYLAYEVEGLPRMESDFTLWTYDAEVLSRQMSEAEWSQVTDVAIERHMARYLLSLLSRSIKLFGTTVPEAVMHKLESADHQYPIDQTSRASSMLIGNFLSIPGLGIKVSWLRQQLFPSDVYMRQVYGCEGFLLIGYVKRLFRGLLKLN